MSRGLHLQRRFLRATGLTRKVIQQIERARRASELLGQGTPILDAVNETGYFDQAHLSNALKRFAGQTPVQITRQRQPRSARVRKVPRRALWITCAMS